MNTVPVRQLVEKFLVAFSFAGEERELVRAIAEAVERSLGTETVFLDEWYEYYIAGSDADLKLQEIYAKRCELAVVCVSGRYGGKPWTLAEHAAIRARMMQATVSPNRQDRDSILPIRVGEGDVENILFNTIVPDVRKKPVAQTAELILNRLRLLVPNAPKKASSPTNVQRVYLAETTPDMDEARLRLKTFLEELGWTVWPAEPYPENEYQARLAVDLPQCRAFIQVLGPYPWKRGGFDRVQSDAAGQMPIARFRYRSSEIDCSRLDSAHREYLTAPDVIATGFEDFKVYLEKELAVLAQRPDQPPAPDIPPRVLVGLRCDNADAVWEKVFQWIYEQERMDHYQLRPGESFTTKFQAEPCQGFLVVCDGTALNDDDRSPREFMEQCRQIQLTEKDADRRPPVGLVYWPPPPASWARLLRSTPLKLHRIVADQPANLGEFFADVRRAAQ